ncbi:MAG TPA: lysylphosphatidylglycerol synthase domain-containing protein [Flavisolibacter sp.]|nr:lysylphosphatidylglycerol synthase domain-containing protein [Flavisolibacter sp.]
MQQRSVQIKSAVTNRRWITKSGLLFYVFSLVIFGFVIVCFSEIRRGFSLLKKVNSYWLLLAVSLQLLTYLFNALIYRLLLKTYKGPYIPSLKEFYKLSVISLFFNQTVPSAGVSGNSFLFSYLEKKNIPSPLILSLILLELLSFYVAIEVIILSFLGLSFLKNWPYVFHTILLTGFLVYLLFTIAVIMTGRKKTFDLLYRKFGKRGLVESFFQKNEIGF